MSEVTEAPDKAVFGTWPLMPYRLLTVYAPWLLRFTSVAVYVCLLCGFQMNGHAGAFGAYMCFAWILADFLEVAGPYFARQRGRITYDTLTMTNWVYIPPTYKGYALFALLLGDFVFLPLCLWSSWLKDKSSFVLPRLVHPSYSASGSIALIVMLWTLACIAVVIVAISLCCLIPLFAGDPFVDMPTTFLSRIPHYAACCVSFLLVPIASTVASTIPCSSSSNNSSSAEDSINSPYTCASTLHRVYAAIGTILLALHFAVSGTLSRSFLRLASNSNPIMTDSSVAPRCDPAMLAFFSAQRFIVVIGSVFFLESGLFYAVALFIACMTLFHSYARYSSSVECVNLMFPCVAAQTGICALFSVCVSLNTSERFIQTSPYWMTAVLVVSAIGMCAVYFKRYGLQLFEKDNVLLDFDFSI